ncbi:MAG: TonB-dependent receptor plug domain-containing protein, partial [Pyrinomonas methylaliphatogenes]|nr:TonB-dependent receptor plug domain-containing protein [Pyrinomonas methylaliphatogenes]
MRRKDIFRILALIVVLSGTPRAFAQGTGGLRGTVVLDQSGEPLHNANVSIVQLRRATNTDEDGKYEFQQIPPGTYRVIVHAAGFPDAVETVTIRAGETATLDFRLKLAPIREEVTVTATGQEQLALEAYQSVTAVNSIDLVQRSHTSLGEALENEPGIAKRSFGPGSARPVIRGFDGDRVLVLQDGLGVGSLGSQSGDHGEPIDVLSVDRIEVVRGPATLLYGSNAIGGVVNAISGRFDNPDRPQSGLRGYLTGSAGTANALGGGGGGFG